MAIKKGSTVRARTRSLSLGIAVRRLAPHPGPECSFCNSLVARTCDDCGGVVGLDQESTERRTPLAEKSRLSGRDS